MFIFLSLNCKAFSDGWKMLLASSFSLRCSLMTRTHKIVNGKEHSYSWNTREKFECKKISVFCNKHRQNWLSIKWWIQKNFVSFYPPPHLFHPILFLEWASSDFEIEISIMRAKLFFGFLLSIWPKFIRQLLFLKQLEY